jgi:hypothetical protein
MINRMFTALLVVMLTAVQPMLAQDGVTTIDLGNATDEELIHALDSANQLELIMRSDWESRQLDARPDFTEEPIVEAEPEPENYTAEVVPEEPDPEFATELPAYVVEETVEEIPPSSFFEESRRLLTLAEEAFDRGDYEAATTYAQEASRLAALSEEQASGEPVAHAYTETAPDADGYYPLPATFTVRLWVVYKDSLWNIAALPEVYGDPHKWPILFEANRHIMPEPNNPNLIEPDMVLEIPSLNGEVREGNWQSGRLYRRR